MFVLVVTSVSSRKNAILTRAGLERVASVN